MTSGSGDALEVSPSFEEFCRRSKVHPMVALWSEVVADTVTPVGVFATVVGDNDGFLLESVEGGERWARYSFIGRRALATLYSRTGKWTIDSKVDIGVDPTTSVLQGLATLLKRFEQPPDPDLPPLHGGVVGYLAYDVVREVEHLDGVANDELGYPDAVLSVIGQLVAMDHWRQRMVLIDNIVVDPSWSDAQRQEAYDKGCRRVRELARDVAAPTPLRALRAPTLPLSPAKARKRTSDADYEANVERAKEYIRAGDIFQVVLSQRFDVEGTVDPLAVYRALRLLNPSPYLYLLRNEAVSVVGSSPEAMVRLRDTVVTSRPIAGSRPRGKTPEEDIALGQELFADEKERAEHVMLVDLARNDVGRVAVFGSETVDEFMTIERYSHIMHMTSQVSGRLRPGVGPMEVIAATLPAGTLSGAPKVRAMSIIDELEPAKRGIYGGIVGYFDFSGNLDTAIAIRTLLVSPNGKASVQAGAGIVADSNPKSENSECMHKAAAILAAITASREAREIPDEPNQ